MEEEEEEEEMKRIHENRSHWNVGLKKNGENKMYGKEKQLQRHSCDSPIKQTN